MSAGDNMRLNLEKSRALLARNEEVIPGGLAQRLEEGQRRLFRDFRLTATISRVGSAHCVYFTERAPNNWWDIVANHDFQFDARYRRALIERGIYYFPVPVKQGSISAAHTMDDIEQTLDATKSALRCLMS